MLDLYHTVYHDAQREATRGYLYTQFTILY
jgi:hypothetical protein